MENNKNIYHPNIVTKIISFDNKALPDPNAKFTTMEKFMRGHNIKGKFMSFNRSVYRFFDTISEPKSKITFNPTIYSEKNGYQEPNPSILMPKKKDNLVIHL